MKLSDKATIPPQVMARTVGEETVILDLASGTYFGLDPIGARIFELLGAGRSLAQVCDAIEQTHEVARETLERDVLALAQTLHERKLIVPA